MRHTLLPMREKSLEKSKLDLCPQLLDVIQLRFPEHDQVLQKFFKTQQSVTLSMNTKNKWHLQSLRGQVKESPGTHKYSRHSPNIRTAIRTVRFPLNPNVRSASDARIRGRGSNIQLLRLQIGRASC